jgi:hypothetical protein
MNKSRLFLLNFLLLALAGLTGFSSTHKKQKSTKLVNQATVDETTKKLDLSLPMPIDDKFDAKTTQAKSELITEKPKKIDRPLELGTQTILTPDPETEKVKSFDGAGITIKIKR